MINNGDLVEINDCNKYVSERKLVFLTVVSIDPKKARRKDKLISNQSV